MTRFIVADHLEQRTITRMLTCVRELRNQAMYLRSTIIDFLFKMQFFWAVFCVHSYEDLDNYRGIFDHFLFIFASLNRFEIRGLTQVIYISFHILLHIKHCQDK